MMMLGATRDVRKVAIWLGHADTRTTEAYLRADPTEKLEAMEAALPLELRRGRFRATDALIAALLTPAGDASFPVLVSSQKGDHAGPPVSLRAANSG